MLFRLNGLSANTQLFYQNITGLRYNISTHPPPPPKKKKKKKNDLNIADEFA